MTRKFYHCQNTFCTNFVYTTVHAEPVIMLSHRWRHYLVDLSLQNFVAAGPLPTSVRSLYKRNWAQSSARTTKIRAQFSAQTTKKWAQFRAWTTKSGILLRANAHNSGTIQHTNETRSGHNFVGARLKHGHESASILQFISCLKTQKQKLYVKKKIFVREGRQTERAGHSNLTNMPRAGSLLQALFTCEVAAS